MEENVQGWRSNDVISKTNDTYPQKLEQQFIDFVGELQQKLALLDGNVVIRMELVRKNTIFRASNWYRKGVWRDWVEIDWGDEGFLPCKIWGFIDLTALEPEPGVNHGSCDITPGCFAIVECGVYDDQTMNAPTRTSHLLPIR